jgi:hypothetical protein
MFGIIIFLLTNLYLSYLSNLSAQENNKDSSISKSIIIKKNPTAAVLFSIIPGGGQFYNEQYWKAPLFMLSSGYLVYKGIQCNTLFTENSSLFDNSIIGTSENLTYRTRRDLYRNDRDKIILGLIGVIGLSMIDSYVSAHLYDFDVDDKLTSNLIITPNNISMNLQIKW